MNEHTDLTDQPIRDTATVTVKDAVDGRKKRRKPSGYVRKAVTTTLTLEDCDPRVVAAAKAIRKPGQLFQIVNPEVIRVING